ncbi:hypothetical protein FS749_004320 [Ceratobasidium sp. UAMH 11750]|nr:hypothetical protein FS749_004320 [Ceratobasidium sp. UAMH 11750]
MFPPSSSFVDWYPGSLSEQLSTFTSDGQGFLTKDFCKEVNAASSCVFKHESRIYEPRLPGEPNKLSSAFNDPMFVYNGYATALEPLTRYLTEPGSRTKLHSSQHYVYSRWLVQLQKILSILKARGNNIDALTYNTVLRSMVLELGEILQ